MLPLNFQYKLKVNQRQASAIDQWLDVCRMVYNYALRERKDWVKARIRKACLDASWGAFVDILSYVCWKRGVYFAKVDANGTSQICPECGVNCGNKTLSQRVHHCSDCGFQASRDVSAACAVFSNLLSSLGFEVGEAHDGEGGWQLAHSFQPHLIVVDLFESEFDGFAFLSRIRQHPNFAC